MSNQALQLAKTIRQLQNIRNVQRASAISDPYMIGLFNGIELALTTLTGKKPDFINIPAIEQEDKEQGNGTGISSTANLPRGDGQRS